MYSPPFEEIAFSDGVQFEGLWDRVWTNRIHRAGTIRFPSGRIVVADALATEFEGHPGFERHVSDQQAEVFAAVAESTTEEGEDDWVTLAAWVRFSDADIVHWEPAWYEGYEPDDNYDPGFGVDRWDRVHRRFQSRGGRRHPGGWRGASGSDQCHARDPGRILFPPIGPRELLRRG